MRIQITADRKIQEIKEMFHRAFPYLKLVFFSKPHQEFKGSPAKFMIMDRDQTVQDLVPDLKEGVVTFDVDTPTFEIESMFEDFGLHVQVFRKSGTLWLETSVTDRLTLQEQNTKGKASEQVHAKSTGESDFNEMN